MEAHDVLADDVQIGRPVASKARAVGVGIVDRGDVVGQRVDPYIHDVPGIARYTHPPVEGRARHREILQAASDEARHLVEPFPRQHEIGMTCVELEQPVLVGGQAEEIALLLHPFDRSALWSDPIAALVEPGFLLVVVGLVAHRVPAGVLVEIDIARSLHALPDGCGGAMVALLGGADECVVRAIHSLDHCLEARHIAFDQLARGEFLADRGLLHLLAVLVGSGEEEHVVAVEPHEAGDRIGGDRLVGVADVGRAIGIGNGRGQVIAGPVSHRRVVSEGTSAAASPRGRGKARQGSLPPKTWMAGTKARP